MCVGDVQTPVGLWGCRAGKKEWVSELYLERNSRGWRCFMSDNQKKRIAELRHPQGRKALRPLG